MFDELKGIKWDLIGLSKVRRTGEAITVLQRLARPVVRHPLWHVLCYRGLVDKKELVVGIPVNKIIAGNLDKYYSVNERVAGFQIRLKKGTSSKWYRATRPAPAMPNSYGTLVGRCRIGDG